VGGPWRMRRSTALSVSAGSPSTWGSSVRRIATRFREVWPAGRDRRQDAHAAGVISQAACGASGWALRCSNKARTA
jgi:hypothetical protein